MESNLRSPDGADTWIFFYGAVYLANSIFFTTLTVLVGLYGVTSTSEKASEFIGHYLNQSCIEVVRSWGKTLLWSLVLIVPGIIKYLQYLFVPFVVATYEPYKKGKVDALEASKAFFKHNWTQAVFALVGFQVVWGALSTLIFDSYRLLWSTPIPAVLITCLEAFIFLLYILVLFRIYSQSLREVKYESAV